MIILKNIQILILFIFISFCQGEHCEPDFWTDELCYECKNIPHATSDGLSCTYTDCSFIVWTDQNCSICYKDKIDMLKDNKGCSANLCDPDVRIGQDKCTKCYPPPSFANYYYSGCTTINCDDLSSQMKFNDETCTICIGKPSFATSDHIQCKELPSLSNFRKINI